MRGTFTLLMRTLVPLATVAQRHLEIGVSPLVTHYHGDLGNYDRAMQWNGLRGMMNGRPSREWTSRN